MANILDGKALSKIIMQDIESRLQLIDKKLRIDFISFGNNKSTDLYFDRAINKASSLGIDTYLHKCLENISESELLNIIKNINNDDNIDGLMIQMPLPKKINRFNIFSSISFKKDIDCLSYNNMGRLFTGDNINVLPCTVKSVLYLIEATNIDLEGANVVIVGASEIVGKPLAHIFLKKMATVTIAHDKTKNLKELCKTADILCVAIGCCEYIDSNYIKDNAIVIDIGINLLEDGSIKGDVKFEDVSKKASFITPVPNGVGAVTLSMIFDNLIILHNNFYKK